jgi:hypothetical protein
MHSWQLRATKNILVLILFQDDPYCWRDRRADARMLAERRKNHCMLLLQNEHKMLQLHFASLSS